jgi:hypothetical protein
MIMERGLGILKWYEKYQKRNGIANEKYTSSSPPLVPSAQAPPSTSRSGASEARKPTLVNFGHQASGRNQRKSQDKLYPHLRLSLQSLVPNTIQVAAYLHRLPSPHITLRHVRSSSFRRGSSSQSRHNRQERRTNEGCKASGCIGGG